MIVIITTVSCVDKELSSAGTDDDTVSMGSSFGGSRADLHRLTDSPLPAWLHPGTPVLVTVSSHAGAGGAGTSGSAWRTGTVQYVGHTEFAAGVWVGVALDMPHGILDSVLY